MKLRVEGLKTCDREKNSPEQREVKPSASEAALQLTAKGKGEIIHICLVGRCNRRKSYV